MESELDLYQAEAYSTPCEETSKGTKGSGSGSVRLKICVSSGTTFVCKVFFARYL